MKTTTKYLAPWLAAAAIGGAMGLTPVASAAPVSPTKSVASPAPSPTPGPARFGAGEDPLVPNGTDPYVPYVLGYNDHSDHDENDTTSGGVDLPF
jgi:hypothetical protein